MCPTLLTRMRRSGPPHYLTLFLAALLLLAGCAAPRSTPGPAGFTPVPPPPGLAPSAIAPLQGAALAQARMRLAQVLTSEPLPPYLAGAASAPASQPAPEPALAVEHLYAAARQAWENGHAFQALTLLDQASDQDPNNPAILRFMAYAYQATNNREKAQTFLARAVSLDPNDVQSLFLLSRRQLELSHWAFAIHGFARLLQLQPEQIDPALPIVARYLLGQALAHEGFDAAAIEQYRDCLASPVNLGRTTRFYRELNLLNDERGTLGIAIGDSLNRLGLPDQAIGAYLQAAPLVSDPDQRRDLIARLVYSDLYMGNPRAAVQRVIEDLRQAHADRAALTLLAYLTDRGVDRADLAAGLRPIYQQLHQPESFAIALAQLLNAPAAREFLRQHVAAHPHDWQAYSALVRADLRLGCDPTRALRSAAFAVEHSPFDADAYYNRLADAAGEPVTLIDAYRDLSHAQRAQPVERFLYARALLLRQRTMQATAQLRLALESDPRFIPARLQLVNLDLRQDQLPRAARLLAPLVDRPEPSIFIVRADLLAHQGHRAQAIDLLDQAIKAHPDDSDLIVAKATLQLDQGAAHGADAEQTLTKALAANPTAQGLYQALYTMYARGLVPDAGEKRIQLLTQAMRNIPNDRFVRLCLAGELAAGGNRPRAEQVLRSLLDEDPHDYDALRQLLRIMYLDNRLDGAQALLARLLSADHPDRALLATAAWFDVAVGDDLIDKDHPAQAADMLRRALTRPTDDPTPIVAALARALAHNHQVDQIPPLFAHAIADHPGARADLRFAWAMLAQTLGQDQRSEELLQAVLKEDPGNDQAANALGYTWADQGRNLDQARELIEGAVQARPDSAAYIDSLGWVYYKLGRFQAAREQLTKATKLPDGTDPTILNHLGDADYRLGHKADALRLWRRARDLLADRKDDDDPELKALGPLLDRKVRAAVSHQPAPVAPSPAGDTAQSEPRT